SSHRQRENGKKRDPPTERIGQRRYHRRSQCKAKITGEGVNRKREGTPFNGHLRVQQVEITGVVNRVRQAAKHISRSKDPDIRSKGTDGKADQRNSKPELKAQEAAKAVYQNPKGIL